MTAILLQNTTEVYYKMEQFKSRRFYYKIRQLLQIATFITYCDSQRWSYQQTLKNFDRDKFKRELEGKINENSNLIGIYDFFGKTFPLVLNNY